MKTSYFRLALLSGLVLLAAGCASAPKDSGIDKDNRISILTESEKKKPQPDPAAADFSVELSEATANADWAQAGRVPDHAADHVAMGETVDIAWKKSVGAGSNGDFRLIAQPVFAGGKVFSMDSQGTVTAFSSAGERLWDFDTTPKEADSNAIGAGLAADGNLLYAATGFGDLVVLKADKGTVLWRKNVGKPLRAPPTVSGGRIYVLTIDNELHALSATNGDEVWHHSGITENATLMGASSPAVSGDNVVVAYSSGEIYDLRAETGRSAWSDALSASAQVGALPAIADIRGLPVIDRNLVFAISHSGRMAAIDLRSGERAWEVELGGVDTPAVSGNAAFVLTNDKQLIALVRTTGQILWVKNLRSQVNPDDPDSDPVRWTGPVLGGGRLWLAASDGSVTSFAPEDGSLQSDFGVDEPIFIAPIIANKTIFVLTDKGHLIALR
jgi:outer membrane protein assembly factor BamB